MVLGQAMASYPEPPSLGSWVDGQGRVDYAAVAADPSRESIIAALAQRTEPTDPKERMAFYINAYNSLTVYLVAAHWPLSSIRDLDNGNPWDARYFVVAGQSRTLNDIEHRILRPMGDPRVHAAINCASMGCPPLGKALFLGSDLDRQLDAACRRWAASTALQIDRAHGVVRLNQIFDWYGEDFVAAEQLRGAVTPVPGVTGKAAAAVRFLAAYVSPEDAAYLRAGGYRTEWAPYSWAVNQQ